MRPNAIKYSGTDKKYTITPVALDIAPTNQAHPLTINAGIAGRSGNASIKKVNTVKNEIIINSTIMNLTPLQFLTVYDMQ